MHRCKCSSGISWRKASLLGEQTLCSFCKEQERVSAMQPPGEREQAPGCCSELEFCAGPAARDYSWPEKHSLGPALPSSQPAWGAAALSANKSVSNCREIVLPNSQSKLLLRKSGILGGNHITRGESQFC